MGIKRGFKPVSPSTGEKDGRHQGERKFYPLLDMICWLVEYIYRHR